MVAGGACGGTLGAGYVRFGGSPLAPSAVAPLYIGPLLDLPHLQLDATAKSSSLASPRTLDDDSDRLTDSETFPIWLSRSCSLW